MTPTVSRIISPTEFAVQSTTELAANEFIFVYGKQVDDLLKVDYDAIAMLNVSATQQIHAEMKALQAEVNALRDDNASLRQKLAESDAKDIARDARLSVIEQMIGSTTLPVTFKSTADKR